MNEPLLVTARMTEPIVFYEDGMHLDGILAWAMYIDLDEEERRRVPSLTEAWALDFDLPLSKWHVVEAELPAGADERLRDKDGVWGWMATKAIADWQKRSVHEIRKRVATEEMIQWTGAKSVTVGQGPGKAYDLKFPTVWAPEVKWYAIGDADEVRRLLTTHVVGIGKHAAKGLGRVAEWTVEAFDVSAQFILDRRRIACDEHKADVIGGIRPPYHHNSRHTWAREPLV